MTQFNQEDFDLFVKLIGAEAGGESHEGRLGVAFNILNRMGDSNYPNTARGVMMQPGQYSSLNDVTGYAGGKGANPKGMKYNPENAMIAQLAIMGGADDPTGGALNFYNKKTSSPKWGPGMTNQVTIGNHTFGNRTKTPRASSPINYASRRRDRRDQSGIDKLVSLFGGPQKEDAPRKTGGIHNVLKGYQDTNLSKIFGLLNRDGGGSLPSGAGRAMGGGRGGQPLGGRSPVSFPQAEQLMAGRASGRGGQNPGPLMQALNSGAFPRARPERFPPQPRPNTQGPPPFPPQPRPNTQMPNAGGGLLSALFGGLFGR